MNTIIEKINNDSLIQEIKEQDKNAEIFLVGGAVRDFLLNKENFDKDIIITNKCAETYAKALAQKLDASFITLDEENKIYRLVLKDKINYIDIANKIGADIKEDLKRRDLTINAIAVNLNTNEILDFSNGINDLKEKKIRHISEENIVDDPLRMLRGYRFASTLGFEIEDEFTQIIKKHAKQIHKSAKERVTYETMKLFEGKNCAKTLLNMDETGLLFEIFPIIEDLKKVPSNLHHHLDLFHHSIETVNQIQKIYEESSSEVKSHLETIDFGGFSRIAHLKLSAFLHDIGKFNTWTIEEETGEHRFIKHDDVGAKMSLNVLKKAKFSKRQIDYISKMIKYHIYPSHVVCAPELNDKIYMRFVRKMENDSIDVIILAMADRLSARGEAITDEIVNKNLNALNNLLSFYISIKDSLEPLPKLLSGEEIMEIINIKPSKELGSIISELKEAQISGEINTKEEAVCFIKRVRENKQ